MSNRIVNVVNSKGTFCYDTSGCFNTNNENTLITSKKDISLNSSSFIINSDTFNLNTDNIINIVSNNNTNEAIIIETYSNNSAIKLQTHKEGQINILSGNINLNASNGNIILGEKCEDNNLENLTQSVSIDALRKVSINTEDFYTIASDSINFISQTGDITFGSQIGESFIKFENNNLLINQQTSPHNRILDIHVNKSDSINNNNGILVYSSQPNINSNIKLENDYKNNLQIGLTSSQASNTLQSNTLQSNTLQTNNNIYKKLIGYQKENIIYLKTFIDDRDINRTITWENNKYQSLLMRPIEYELQPIIYKSDLEINARLINKNINFINNKYLNFKEDIIGIIILIENKNKFKWGYINKNNNIIFDFDDNNCNKNIEITKEPIILDNIEITFPVITGYNIGDYWKVSLIQTIKTTTNNTISLQNCFIIKNRVGFISTSNNELQLNTSNNNRMYISSEGGISFNNINNNISPNTFNISNSFNRENYVSIEGAYLSQCNNQILPLNSGGYIITWEEKYKEYSYIYFKKYNADGNSNSKKVMINTSKTGYHQQPYLSNCNDINHNDINENNNTSNFKEKFIVVWSKKDTLSNDNNNNNNNNDNNIYNLYAQIFIDYKKKKGFDIPLGSIYNNKNNINIKSTRLYSGNFVIVWSGEDNNIGHFSIYGLILDIGGNIIKQRFQISEPNSLYSYSNPFIYTINDKNDYMVLYYTKNNDYNNEYNNEYSYNIYDIKYKILNENNIKSSENQLISCYSYGSFQLLNNSLYLTTFEPLFLNDKIDDEDTYKIISINKYKTVNIVITIDNIKDNIIKVDNEYLNLFEENDIVCIEKTNNSKKILYNSKIDFINKEKNVIVLSKNIINLSLYKFDLLENKIIFNHKIHNIHNITNNKTELNINIHKKLYCNLSYTDNNDMCIVWGNENFGVFISLLSSNLEFKIYDNKLINSFRGVSNIKIQQIFSKNKIDSGLVLSYLILNNDYNDYNNKTNVMYKCINLYNDIFKVNNYKNEVSINNKGYLRIGEKNNEYNESNLYVNGSISSKIITVSNLKKYIVSHNDNTILVDTSNNDVDIILDNNHTYYGIKYIIKHIKGNNNVIIKSPSLIDDKYEYVLNNIWNIIELQSNGNQWYILRK